jgi:hypothetical protein
VESKTVNGKAPGSVAIGGRSFTLQGVRRNVSDVVGRITETMKCDGEQEVVGLFAFFQHADGRVTIAAGGALCPGDLASAALGRAFAIESQMTLENLSKCLLKPEESR